MENLKLYAAYQKIVKWNRSYHLHWVRASFGRKDVPYSSVIMYYERLPAYKRIIMESSVDECFTFGEK